MAPFLSVSSILAVLTLFLHFSYIIYVEAVRDPNEPLIEAPAMPKLKVYQYAIFHRTVRDAIPIAKHTAMYWPCDATTDAVSPITALKTVQIPLRMTTGSWPEISPIFQTRRCRLSQKHIPSDR